MSTLYIARGESLYELDDTDFQRLVGAVKDELHNILDDADEEDEEADDYGDEDAPDSVKAAGQASVEAFTPLRTLFIRLAARRSCKSEAEVSKALAHLEADSGRPFLDWLLDGGLEKLIDILLKLLPLLV